MAFRNEIKMGKIHLIGGLSTICGRDTYDYETVEDINKVTCKTCIRFAKHFQRKKLISHKS